MKELLRRVVSDVYRILPKFPYAVLWGWPDIEDSVLALLAKLGDRDLGAVVVLLSHRAAASVVEGPLPRRIYFLRKNSPAGFLCFLFARYVFFTHRCFVRRFPPNVVSVNVWHGMMIKKLGCLQTGDTGIQSRYLLATSDCWAEIAARAMRPFGPVLTTGLPRNDRLFLQKPPVLRKAGLADRCDVRHIVAWLPTYRRSVRGEIRDDGSETNNPFALEDANAEEINEFGKKHNMLIWVKPHPMSRFCQPTTLSHLLVFDNAWLLQKRLSLYEWLGAADVLITDISSVYVDYLLLDRPIIHSFPDMDAYRDNRGFTLEPLADFFAGPVAATWQEIAKHLALIASGRDPYSERRRHIRNLFHLYKDGNATERLLDALGIPIRRP